MASRREHSTDLASERVERAKRRFDESWLNRDNNARAVEEHLDELDVAVGLWLVTREARESAV